MGVYLIGLDVYYGFSPRAIRLVYTNYFYFTLSTDDLVDGHGTVVTKFNSILDVF